MVVSNLILGAFVAAPIGGFLWAFGAMGLRIGYQWLLARLRGHRFDSFDRPQDFASSLSSRSQAEAPREEASNTPATGTSVLKGRFF